MPILAIEAKYKRMMISAEMLQIATHFRNRFPWPSIIQRTLLFHMALLRHFKTSSKPKSSKEANLKHCQSPTYPYQTTPVISNHQPNRKRKSGSRQSIRNRRRRNREMLNKTCPSPGRRNFLICDRTKSSKRRSFIAILRRFEPMLNFKGCIIDQSSQRILKLFLNKFLRWSDASLGKRVFLWIL